MKKISLYVDDAIYKKLAKHAARKGLKTAQLIRVIWLEWLTKHEGKKGGR